MRALRYHYGVKSLKIMLWVLAGLAGIVAVFAFAIAMLAFAGVLTDTSPAENRAIGFDVLWFALAAESLCMLLLVIACLLPGRRRGSSDATGH